MIQFFLGIIAGVCLCIFNLLLRNIPETIKTIFKSPSVGFSTSFSKNRQGKVVDMGNVLDETIGQEIKNQ